MVICITVLRRANHYTVFMNSRKIQIQERHAGRLLASAETLNRVQMFEGAWYFDPTAVDMTHLIVTERTYTCPYKGVCA
jgi:uncharacterized protein (DUF427 family)